MDGPVLHCLNCGYDLQGLSSNRRLGQSIGSVVRSNRISILLTIVIFKRATRFISGAAFSEHTITP